MNKHVFEKIAKLEKTELSEVKVDLALTDDMTAYIKGYDKFVKEADGLVQRAQRLSSELKDTAAAIFKYSDLGLSMSQDVSNMLAKFEQQAKDLGIDPKESKVYNETKSAYTKYYQKQTDLQKIAKEFNK